MITDNRGMDMNRLRKAVIVWRKCKTAEENNINLSNFLPIFLGETLDSQDIASATNYNKFVWSPADDKFYQSQCACSCKKCPIANENRNEEQQLMLF